MLARPNTPEPVKETASIKKAMQLYKLGIEKQQTHQTYAHYCFGRALQLGYLPARYQLGHCYEHGIGVPRNLKQALVHYRMSAAEGNASANFKVGTAALAGKAMPQSDTIALKYLRKAANLGQKEALLPFVMLSLKLEQQRQQQLLYFDLLKNGLTNLFTPRPTYTPRKLNTQKPDNKQAPTPCPKSRQLSSSTSPRCGKKSFE